MEQEYPRTQLKGNFESSNLLVISGDDGEILRFERNGDIYVKGRLVENDKEVVEGFREFLSQYHK